jgi:hypothetical protein
MLKPESKNHAKSPNFGKLVGDTLEWSETDEITAVQRFINESSNNNSNFANHLLIKFRGSKLDPEKIMEEYDCKLHRFLPYSSMAYVILNDNDEIEIMTIQRPSKYISNNYRKMYRHMALHYSITGSAVPYYELL